MASHAKFTRRSFLQGVGLAGATIRVGLPALEALFNASGTAYAATEGLAEPIETRFVFWFNGNGIVEKYWIPREEGSDYELTPCLQPLARLRGDVHVKLDFPRSLWAVEVDPGELELVVLNLAVNARDAMPEGGTITVRARNAPGQEEERPRAVSLPVEGRRSRVTAGTKQ